MIEDKKKVLVVWEYPQLTEDPIAEVFLLGTGEKVDEAELDCTYFDDGGGRIVPGKNDNVFTEQCHLPDKFMQVNKDIFGLPSADARYRCILRDGTPGKLNLIEGIFKSHFSVKYEVVSIRRIRRAK